MQCFKCGFPQPTNAEAARLGAIAALNKIEEIRQASIKSLTRTEAPRTPEDEIMMRGFEEGWRAALGLFGDQMREVADKNYSKEQTGRAT